MHYLYNNLRLEPNKIASVSLKEGVSQGFKSWAVLNIMPFLKGFEDSFVKRPQ